MPVTYIDIISRPFLDLNKGYPYISLISALGIQYSIFKELLNLDG